MSGPILFFLKNCFKKPDQKPNVNTTSQFSSNVSTPATSRAQSPTSVSVVDAIMAMSTEPLKNPNGQTVLNKKEIEDLQKFVSVNRAEIEMLRPKPPEIIAKQQAFINRYKRNADAIHAQYYAERENLHILYKSETTKDGRDKVNQKVKLLKRATMDRQQENEDEFRNEIINLYMPHTFRYSYKDKNKPDLPPRTIDFTFDHNGQPTLVIQTNQKAYENITRNLPLSSARLIKNPAAVLGKGSYKTGKTCYTVADGQLTPIARLQYDFNDEAKDISSMLKEMEFAQRHKGSEYIDTPFLGSIYTHKRNGKNVLGCYMYSTPAICSLDKLTGTDRYGKPYLTRDELDQLNTANQKAELPDFYIEIIKDALHGLAEIHAAGEIHRDIKPDNILIYRGPDGKLHAKISDPGLAVTHAQNAVPAASLDYASPQVFYGNSAPDDEFNHYFFASAGDLTCPGRMGYDANKKAFSGSDKFADPRDDMYALGICIMEFMAGRRLFAGNLDDTNINRIKRAATNFKKNEQFGSLIATKRQDRPSAAQLLSTLELKPTTPTKLTLT